MIKWYINQGLNILSAALAWLLGIVINPFLPKGAPLLGNADVSLSMWSGIVIEDNNSGKCAGWHTRLAVIVQRVTTYTHAHDHVYTAIERTSSGDYAEEVLRK